MNLKLKLARKGKVLSDFKGGPAAKGGFKRSGVPAGSEFKRIQALPRRRWQDDEELEVFSQAIKEVYGMGPRECPKSCVCRGVGDMDLRMVQAAMLKDAMELRGIMSPVVVGGGKTLASYLAPTVMESEVALLLIPAKLRKKTEVEFKKLRRHWVQHPNLHIMTYEYLSREKGLEDLQKIMPDLIIADEAHRLKNTGASCTKRLRAYLKEHEPAYLDLSGTLTKRSILDYAHRMKWALPEGKSPLPERYSDLRDWADALDEKKVVQMRLAPGALADLCSPEQLELFVKQKNQVGRLGVIRQAYRDRLTQTPGIIATEEIFDTSIKIQIKGIDIGVSEGVEEAFETLREMWETPGGKQIEQASELWRVAREFSCGFYYEWDPAPPKEWMDARREWGVFVREHLKHSRKFFSPMDVAKWCKEEPLSHPEYQRWQMIRGSFKPNSVPRWIDDRTLRYCTDWMKEHKGLVWVEHVAFGKKLSEVSGVPYYGRQGLCPKGNMVEDEEGAAIVSIAANSEGRNLQYNHHKNLIVSVPPGGLVWEQLLGRSHRPGQTKKTVYADMLVSCYEQRLVFQQSLLDAKYSQDSTGQPQKLIFADVSLPNIGKGEAWSEKSSGFFKREEEADDGTWSNMTSEQRHKIRMGLDKF